MTSVDRLQRLLSLIRLLQSNRALSSKDLAELLGVARRTVFRDIASLGEAGFPVAYRPERGGYALLSSLETPRIEITAEEALSLQLFCYDLGDNGHGVPFQAAARSAAMKLMQIVPDNIRETTGALTDLVELRLEQRNPLSHARPYYDDVLSAFRDRKSLRIHYGSLAEQKQIRTLLSPYKLVFSRRSWYVIGRSSIHRAVRTFNLGRFVHAEPTDNSYRIPKGFSVDRYLGNAWHLVRETPYRCKVRVKFSKLVARNVAEIHWHKTQKIVEHRDGTMTFEVKVDGLNEISWWILGYGDQAEVLQPKPLRELVAGRAAQLYHRYHDTESSGAVNTVPRPSKRSKGTRRTPRQNKGK